VRPPPRSKLEPHQELIRELRLKRWSYRAISILFEKHLHMRVAPSTLHNFVKVRSKQKRTIALPSARGPGQTEKNDAQSSLMTRKRVPRRFTFTPGEALQLSSHGKEKK